MSIRSNGTLPRADNNVAMAHIDKTGGPAFPTEYAMPEGGNLTFPGMTLRD